MPTALNNATENSLQEVELKLYYSRFHHAHPVLPPFSHVALLPKYVVQVMIFVGSQFLQQQRRENLLPLLRSQQPSAFVVQGMVILTVVLHAQNEPEEAMSLLDEAVSLALALKMHETSDPVVDNVVLRESFKRTWWELCVVDGLLSAIHRRTTLRTNVEAASIALPGNSDLRCDSSYTFSQLTDRYFAATDLPFSSASYRIEAVHILSHVLSLAETDDEDRFSSSDAQLTSWQHHIPASKSEILDQDGNVDEMMFQAHMIIHFATILLHLSRSSLHVARSGRVTCTPQINAAPATFTPHIHAVRATKAANEISRLASLPVDQHKHTPLWICSLVLGVIVQLSACCVSGTCKCLSPHRHRIIQTIGMLKTLAKTWPIAGFTLEQVRGVANEIMAMESGWAEPAESPCDLDLANDARLLDNTSWDADLAGLLMLQPGSEDANGVIDPTLGNLDTTM